MKHFRTRAEMVNALVPPNSVGAEIGVFLGQFAHVLCDHTKLAKLYCVDSWARYDAYDCDPHFNRSPHEANFDTAQIVLRKFIEAGRAEIVRGFSAQVALEWAREPLDWFYLDANHRREFVLIDLVAWSLRLKPGGFIMGHDYIRRDYENFGVIEAVDEFCRRFNWSLEYTTQDDIDSYALFQK